MNDQGCFQKQNWQKRFWLCSTLPGCVRNAFMLGEDSMQRALTAKGSCTIKLMFSKSKSSFILTEIAAYLGKLKTSNTSHSCCNNKATSSVVTCLSKENNSYCWCLNNHKSTARESVVMKSKFTIDSARNQILSKQNQRLPVTFLILIYVAMN